MGSRAPLAVLVATVMSMAVGCGGDDAGVETPPAVTFDGSSWVMERGTLDDVDSWPIEGRAPTLAVEGDRAIGSTGCNSYELTIEIDVDGLLAFTDFSVTEIGCDPAVMDVEVAMLAVLAAVDRFDLDGNRLTFANGDGTAQLVMTASSPTASNGSTPDPTES